MEHRPESAAHDAAETHPGTEVSQDREARNARMQLMHLLEPQDCVGMALVEAFGPIHTLRIVLEHRDLEPEEYAAISEMGSDAMSTLTGRGWERAKARWAARTPLDDPERIEGLMAARGAWLVTPEDPDWPVAFGDLGAQQPLALWGRGDRNGLLRPAEENVAIVGCRDSTPYGKSVATRLAGDLAALGYGVLSGAAFGIDAAAHRAALEASVHEPSTVAFLACGIDRSYPRAHADLLSEISESGLVLTEVGPGCSPMRHRFLQRNRLIAALSCLVVVVEAGWRSGALNTAHHALDMGHEVAAVPGSVFSPQSAGCHRLIAETPSRIVTSTRDVTGLVQAPVLPGAPAGTGRPDQGQGAPSEVRRPQDAGDRSMMGLTQIQQLVLDALPVGKHVPAEKLCAVAGLGIREVIPALAQLEAYGLAEMRENRWRMSRP
ncbi:DNA-processing protein DprA [Rothia sp. HC945]|uniref:DNA-processing protein DprA n=1 Tax=Rothia sp. HC945 TaxID=3171170 RepID=UPI003F24A58B